MVADQLSESDYAIDAMFINDDQRVLSTYMFMGGNTPVKMSIYSITNDSDPIEIDYVPYTIEDPDTFMSPLKMVGGGYPEEMVLSTSEKYLFIWSGEGVGTLCNAETGEYLTHVEGFNKEIKGAVFSPDDRFLVAWGKRNNVCIYEILSDNILPISEVFSASVVQCRFISNHNFIVHTNDSILHKRQVGDQPSKTCVIQHPGIMAFQISKDGKNLMTYGRDNSIRRWNTINCEPVQITFDIIKEIQETP